MEIFFPLPLFAARPPIIPRMEPTVFLMVLTAAGLHAAWNILLKTARNGEAAMTGLSLTYGLGGAAMIPFLSPPPPQTWPLLAATTALHVGYNLALVRAYREGDFSRAYPIARGAAPLLAATAAALFLDERLRPVQWAGMALAAGGVISLSCGRHFERRQTVAALGVAVFIAAYSAVDAAGARWSEKIGGTAMIYIAWAFMLDGFSYALTVRLRRGPRAFSAARAEMSRGITGGALAFMAYGLALAAYAKAPVGMVAAVREVSIIIAAFYGAVVLREGFILRRTAAAAVTVAGLAVLLAG